MKRRLPASRVRFWLRLIILRWLALCLGTVISGAYAGEASAVPGTGVTARTNKFGFRPALAGSGPSSPAQRLAYPAAELKTGQKAAVVFCCDVDETGKVSRFRAEAATPKSKPFITAVRKAVEGSRFEPATVGDLPVKVFLTATVCFTIQESKPVILFYLSSDIGSIAVAKNYFGPQLIGGSRALFRCLDYPGEALLNREQGNLLAEFRVGSDGSVKDLGFVEGSSTNRSFRRVVQKSVLGLRFIPALEGGRPVEATNRIPVIFVGR